MEENLRYVLALQKVKGIGDTYAKKLINYCGSAKAVFEEKEKDLCKINGITPNIMKNLKNPEIFQKAEEELKFIEQNNIQTVYFESEEYPDNLKQCLDSPILLFKDGNFDFKDRKTLSIVGTRNMTSNGRIFCQELVEEVASYDPIIVSGFAYGVDICAHLAALDNHLKTVAVLAHGFGHIYPKVHKKYVNKINDCGGFLTDFWYEMTPQREFFLSRNRIVAGISDAVIVIESAEKGGSLATAEIANSYQKDVFAVPGRVSDKFSVGCNNLIKNHKATMITSPSDLIKALKWDEKKQKPIQKMLFVNLDEDEQKIFDFLEENGMQLLDLISLNCDIPIHKVASILLNLELKGVIRPLPGKMFELA
ncbi:DNA-processing protein DprA [Aureivirga sp. CE67]|uniref:DNA-processing protein DprA n=1 Tax=Aureivirga sp. CE67 TaxID=1788983 RepID=UPI0018CAB072|nr:DNA-processing protein DprA [Aureivirga sp. CE67]